MCERYRRLKLESSFYQDSRTCKNIEGWRKDTDVKNFMFLCSFLVKKKMLSVLVFILIEFLSLILNW